MHSGEVKMWRAVIQRAIADAFNKKLADLEQIEALEWICNGGLDFEVVCDLANVTPKAVREFFSKKRIYELNRKTSN
jgi:thiamine monophosphate kinase